MIVFLVILIGVLLIGAGVAFHGSIGVVSAVLVAGFGGLVFIFGVALAVITKLYVKTTANEAFVRTGWGKAKVVLDGGAFVVPIIHKLVPVSLETMRLNVIRRGEEALITGDNLRVDIAAEFYIKVQPELNDILNAARSLGERSVSEGSIRELVMEKLISALRTVAATRSLVELHTKRDEFAAAVQQIVTQDLQENGLTLESVTISSLDQTPVDLLKDDNIFDAQGKRRITEITQVQLVQRNEIERNAQRDIRDKDVSTRKQILDLDKDREFAEATQARDVANVQAERKRETQEFAIQQAREVELAEVAKELAVQQADISKQRDLAVAQAQREEAERLAQIARDKAQQEADVAREQAVEVARRQAEVAVANEETRRAQAQAETRAAEAKRQEETERIETVRVTAEADRRAQQKMITEKQQVDIKQYEDQVEADVKAYTAVKVAEGDLEAADKQKQAMLILAEGEAQSNKLRAEGQRAIEMVPVQIEREKVNVEAARVEVRRQDLENQERFSEAALDFELKKEQIAANRDVQIEMAKAIATMLQSADMHLFGDPSTVATMTQQFLRSVGWGLSVKGLVDSTPEDVRQTATQMVRGTGEALRDVVSRFTGGKVALAPEALEQIVSDAIIRAHQRTDEAEAEPPTEEPEPQEETEEEEES